MEAGAQRAAFCRVDLSAAVETVVDAFAPSAEDEGRRITAHMSPGIAVHGDKELLTQMLVNLVENALRHTPGGTEVQVSLSRLGQRQGVPVVQDNGPCIPRAERERVLWRFDRLDHSRTARDSGLGLSLVAAVAELHGAALPLEDAQPGLRVAVALGMVGDLRGLAPEAIRMAS